MRLDMDLGTGNLRLHNFDQETRRLLDLDLETRNLWLSDSKRSQELGSQWLEGLGETNTPENGAAG